MTWTWYILWSFKGVLYLHLYLILVSDSIIPCNIDLAMFGGEILCQPDAFLCSINDVKVSNTFVQRAHNMIASAEGSLRHKILGQGLAFIVGGGSDMKLNLIV